MLFFFFLYCLCTLLVCDPCSPSDKMEMNFVTFNQDYSYLAVATSKGFRIYTTDPFAKSYETKEGNIAIIEMLFSTSLVALILSPRRLQITNTKVRRTP